MKSSERPECYRHKYGNLERLSDSDLVETMNQYKKIGSSKDKEFIDGCERELSWRRGDKQLI